LSFGNGLGCPSLLAGGVIAYIGPINSWSETPVATPNYGYEKRQKELAKKRKKEDKLKAKAERKTQPGPGDASGNDSGTVGQNHTPSQE
jgi:hypothetical protein